MSFPSCPSCGFPDPAWGDRVPVRVSEHPEEGERPHEVPLWLVRRRYVCAGCRKTFGTTEAVDTIDAKTVSIRHLYPGRPG